MRVSPLSRKSFEVCDVEFSLKRSALNATLDHWHVFNSTTGG